MDLNTVIALTSALVGAAAAIAALVGLRWQRNASRPAEIEKNVEQFKENYAQLAMLQTELSAKRLDASRAEWRHDDFPLLTLEKWLPRAPVPLEKSILQLVDVPAVFSGRGSRAPKLEGLSPAGPITYSRALTEIAGKDFSSGIVYRPLSMSFAGGSLTASFATTTYFDYLDTSEVLSYLTYSDSDERYRRSLGSPFDLSSRMASLGILTLTLINEPDGGVSFMMHQRSSAVSLGTGLYHVVPAGEFAPSDRRLSAVREDLSLWRNIAREYAEELLGDSDAQGDGGKRIDYLNSTPYRQLTAAGDSGDLVMYILGLGLDPLSWKPELLTVACFQRGAFDSCFGVDLPGNEEGQLLEGEVFDRKCLEAYLSSPRIRPGARACLMLAWTHRAALGLDTQ